MLAGATISVVAYASHQKRDPGMVLVLPYHARVSMARMPYANWILIGVTSLIGIRGRSHGGVGKW